jgi:hypothetical protein
MDVGRAADWYGIVVGHAIEQADAGQAYAQVDLEESEAWARLPQEAWLDS